METKRIQSDYEPVRAYFQRHPVRQWIAFFGPFFAFTSAIYDLEDHFGLFISSPIPLSTRYLSAVIFASLMLAWTRWQAAKQPPSSDLPAAHAPDA